MTIVTNGTTPAATLATDAAAALTELQRAEAALAQLQSGLNQQQIDVWNTRIRTLRQSYVNRFGPVPG